MIQITIAIQTFGTSEMKMELKVQIVAAVSVILILYIFIFRSFDYYIRKSLWFKNLADHVCVLK